MQLRYKIKKKTIQFIIYLFFFPLIIGCLKDKQKVISNDWQVESIQTHPDSALKFPVSMDKYTLEFKNKFITKKEYSFQIGSNICAGKVKFSNKNGIKFTGGLVTLAMWDSFFSENVYCILISVHKYQVTNETLVLISESGGIINLKRK